MRPDVRELSRELATALGQLPETVPDNADFMAGEHGRRYPMVWTPEGYAVHQDEGCRGEVFHGPLGCYHSEENTVTQAVTRYEDKVPQRIDFTDEQLKTITDVICVDYQGNKAPPAFVQLYLAACRHTGLDPFLRQIYALNLKGKWTMYVGIDGYRVISERTGLDQGMDGPQWSDDGETWYDFPDEEPARYCRVGIWRKGVPRPYVVVLSMASKINPASDSWQKDPNGMLAKCCEALARRRAFPADMSVLPNDVQFSVEDTDGAPLTRAEVPEGSFREIAEPVDVQAPPAPPRPTPGPRTPGVNDQQAAWEQEPVVQAARVERDAAMAQAIAKNEQATGPIALLNAIGEQQGLGAKQAAIKVMTRLFGTAAVTNLDDDPRAEYTDILAFRLAGTTHEHEEAFTANGVLICRLCGDALEGDTEVPAQQPSIAVS